MNAIIIIIIINISLKCYKSIWAPEHCNVPYEKLYSFRDLLKIIFNSVIKLLINLIHINLFNDLFIIRNISLL